MTSAYNQELLSSYATSFSRASQVLSNIEDIVYERAVERLGEERAQEIMRELGLDRKKILGRRFSVNETCALLGITRQGLYKAEKSGRLPPPDMKSTADNRQVRAGYTFHQLCHMREVLDALPDPLPRTAVVGILNQKGGAQKTTTTLNLAQYLVMLGYRVLVVDSDPQCSLTSLLGLRPDVDFGVEATLAPFLLQRDSIFEDDNGDFVEGYEPEMLADLQYAVRPTYWPNLHIIPASSETMETDLEAAKDLEEIVETYIERTGKNVGSISELIVSGLQPLKAQFDVILIDGTPSLNVTTVNIIAACDEILVPTPAHMLDFASTTNFLRLISSLTERYVDQGIKRAFPNLSFLITKFTNSEASATMESIVRHSFGDRVLKNAIELSDAVREAGNEMLTVYEISPADKAYSKRLKSAVENYDAVFTEVLTRVIKGQIATTGSLFSNGN